MNYVIFNADGSVLAQNLEYYIQQGNSGDEIFIGFADALATDTTIAVFTLPNQDQDTNTVAGVYGSKTIEIEGVSNTYNGWTITLTLAQTTYNGLLTMAIRIIRDSQIIVSYPIALVINETGVKPDADSGVTIEELNSYLLQLQQVAIGCIRYDDFDPESTTLQDVANKVGVSEVFAMKINDTIAICELFEGDYGYYIKANTSVGLYESNEELGTEYLANLVWNPIVVTDNVIAITNSTGTFTTNQLDYIRKGNCYINYNGTYYRKVSDDGTTAVFKTYSVYDNLNLISVWGAYVNVTYATGDYVASGQLYQIYDSSVVELKANKVTSISNTSTDDQYPSAKCVYDNFKKVIEMANGKCSVYGLSYAETLDTSNYSKYHYLNSSSETVAFTSQQALEDYVDDLTSLNSAFNSQNDTLTLSSGYLIVRSVYTSVDTQYLVLRKSSSSTGFEYSNMKLGDVFLVYETDVPDRWLGQGPVGPSGVVLYKMETAKIDLTNYVDLSSAQTITGVKTFYSDTLNFKANANANNIWSIEITDYLFNIKRAGASWVNFSDNSFIFGRSLRPDGNGTRDLGTSTGPYYWKDLYLSGKAYIPEIADANGTSRLSISTAGVVTLNGNIYPNVNNASLLGYSARIFNTIYTNNIANSTLSFTVDSAYDILYGKTINNLPILEYENKNVITTSTGTSITLRAAKTGCLPTYEGFITNLSGSAISFGFPNSLTLLTNDEDNVSVSGSILTIGAGVTIEFSLCDNKLVAINWAI